MRTHAEIIRPQDAPALAQQLGVSVHTVLSWRQRNSIPAEHWKALDAARIASLEELADAAAAKKRADAAPGEAAA